MNIGLRYSCFQYGGPININSFLRKEWTRDTSDIHRNIEPRISARYNINKNSSIKASYNENYQYIHLSKLI